MKLFSAVYTWTMRWAKHKFAPHALALLTFAESVFFPVPPDVLLAPMVLAKPKRAWRYATITTIASVIGGVVGYWLGFSFFEPLVQPIIQDLGYQAKFEHVIEWFEQWGVWVVFIAGFSPIPYKLFTLSAGFLQMAFFPFLFASTIGRGARFFLVAALMHWGGEAMEAKLQKWIDIIGWAVVVLIIIAYFIMR